MLVVSRVEIGYVKDAVARRRHRVMVYWNRLELVCLQKIEIF
jgi:hypothetical protein